MSTPARRRRSRSRGAVKSTGLEQERGGVRSMNDALSEFLDATKLLQRKKAIPAIQAWEDAVGESIAARARAVSFRRGELIVEVDSQALLAELRGFAAEDLRTRADELLEGATIRKVTFKLQRRR